MKQVYYFDTEGHFLYPIIIYPNADGTYSLPENSTDIPLPLPNWKPVFRNGTWIETITEAELEQLKIQPGPQPTEIELLGQTITDLELRLITLEGTRNV